MNPHAHDTSPAGPEPEALTEAQLAEMEEALGTLALAEPSPLLDHRVAAALRDVPKTPAGGVGVAADTLGAAGAAVPHPGRSRWLTGLAIAAVVALLAALGLTLYLQSPAGPEPGPIVERTPDTPPTSPNEGLAANDPTSPGPTIQQAGYNFQPEPVKLRWTRDLDQGLLTQGEGQPVRAIRRQDIEQEVWIDPERGVTIQINRPRERLVVVKQPTF